MPRYRRGSRSGTTTDARNWKPFYREAVIRGMYDYWTGRVGTNLEASASRLVGSTQSEATNYTNSRYYWLGVQSGQMFRHCAQNGILMPTSEGELGRLILGEETNFVESAIDSADDFFDSPLEWLEDTFTG